MTRKDYILIAKAITDTQERIKAQSEGRLDKGSGAIHDLMEKEKCDHQLRGVRRVAAHLADALADDNPRGFDPAMFLKNCGYGGTTMNPRDPALDLRPLPGEGGNTYEGCKAERPTALNLSALERAYDEGRAAFVSGMPCPYNIATAEHAQFMSGRHAALVEHERATKTTATR